MSKQATNQENGFSNFKPAGRDVRKIQGDRHLFEKNLLANRKEGFQRHDPNPNPLHVPVSAAGFQKDTDRFHSDVASEEKATAQFYKDRKIKVYGNIRQQRVDREENRWKQLAEDKQKQETKIAAKRQVSKQNISSVTYDLVTLSDNGTGETKYMAQMDEFKGALRAAKLQQRNCSTGFNPITGEKDALKINIPDKPSKPNIVAKKTNIM